MPASDIMSEDWNYQIWDRTIPGQIGTFKGSQLAVKRAEKYEGTTEWKVHSHYKLVTLYRAYHLENGKPCALYMFGIKDHQFVAESLDVIKKLRSYTIDRGIA